MKKNIRLNIEDTTVCLEEILTMLPELSLEDKIDLGGRMKGIVKNATAIDEALKTDLKPLAEAELKKLQACLSQPKSITRASLLGNVFKVVLALVPTTRLDQKALKEEKPKIHAAYNKPVVDQRLTYEVR